WKKIGKEGRTHPTSSTDELTNREKETLIEDWGYRENEQKQLIVSPENGPIVVRAIYETTGHPGLKKLCRTVKRTFQITNLYKIAYKIVMECKLCQRYKKQNTLCPKNQSL